MTSTVELQVHANPFEAGTATDLPATPTRSDATRRWLCVAQLLAIVVTSFVVLLEIRYLVWTFPPCVVLGLMFAISVRRLQSWTAFLYGMSAPIVAVVSGMMIACFAWNPPDAETPIRLVWWIYTLFATLAFRSVYPLVRAWRSAEHSPRPGTWRFQIQFLLIQTLILSVLLAVVKSFSGDGHNFTLVFAAVSAGIIFVGGLVTAAFLAELYAGDEPIPSKSSDNPFLS